MRKPFVLVLFLSLLTYHLKAQVEPLLLYKAQQDDDCRQWVEATLAGMTLQEKVGQLFVYTIAPNSSKSNMNLLRDAVSEYKVGGLLFSGGELRTQAELTNYAQNHAQTPLMITFDGEWGLAMRLKNTPSFPRNMALGCVQDERLIYEYGKEVARQLKEMGVQVNFAPVADVNINPDNPVINTRSFGEDPVNVSNKVLAYSSGLESGGVLSVVKHFPGHGDTDVDSHHALPVLPFSRARMDSVELYPFRQAIRAGQGGVMVGHLQVPELDSELLPASLSPALVSGLLKNELQFRGLVFTDALAMKGVIRYGDVCAKALIAGSDMVLTPPTIKSEMRGVMSALEEGTLTEEMVDEKCRKVLTYKYALGLKSKKQMDLTDLEKRVSTPAADSLVNRLRLAAITVVGNQNRTLPLHSKAGELAILSLCTNSGHDTEFVREMGKQAKVTRFTLSKGTESADRARIKQQLAQFKQIVVSVTATDIKEYDAYLTALADSSNVVYSFFSSLPTMQKVPSVLFSASAVVLGHSREALIQRQVAHLLYGKATADGRLSAGVPGIFKAGDGITLGPSTPLYYAPEEVGVNPEILSRIDSIARKGIKEGAYPGCQIYIMKEGKTIYDKCFGRFTYDSNSPYVENTDLYDLASLTKTTGTLLAVMKLYDRGLINLDDPLSRHLPFLRDTDKADLRLRELLLHESGLPSSIFFYRKAVDDKSYTAPFIKNRWDNAHPVQMGKRAFAPRNYKFKEGLVATAPSDTFPLQVADKFWLNIAFRDTMLQEIADVTLHSRKYVYSCVNFILLKEVVEHIAGKSLDAFLEEEFFEPMGLERITYLPLRYFDQKQIVPSARGDFLRRNTRNLQGYVHDEAAAFFGGISGNAGLFGNAASVAAIHQLWLNGGAYRGKRYLSEETCRMFTTTTSDVSRRALGFDKPDAKNPEKSPCAPSAPATVYGHTGFTGTCAWVDPDNKLVYVFLSNRTYPQPWNGKLMTLNIRPKIQEVIYEASL